MQTSGGSPQVGVRAGDIVDLVTGPGSFVSAYLTTEAAVENAG